MKLKEYLKMALAFPQEIHLESSSKCNARCIMCPRDGMERYQGDMSRELFLKAVHECEGSNLKYIHFHLNGEPLMMDIDELCWRIKYARKLNPEEYIEGKTTGLVFFTNGSLLTKERIEKILDSGLDILVISIDGGNKEDYERVRVGLKFETVVENVKNLVEMRNKSGVKMKLQTAIVPQKANEKTINLYHRIFNEIGVDDVGGSGVQNIGGLIDSESMILKDLQTKVGDINAPCWRVFLDLSITASGKATVCCQDVRAMEIIGDLNTQTLKEIWHGERIMNIRQKFAEGRKAEIPFCAKCDYMSCVNIESEPAWKANNEFVTTFTDVCRELDI